MSTADAHYVVVLGTNYVQTAFLPALFPFVYALEHQVWFGRTVDCYHLHLERVPFCHKTRERLFTYFTLEFSKVVRNNHSSDFFLDFAIDPHLQALYMNPFTGAFALAWRNKEVVGRTVIA